MAKKILVIVLVFCILIYALFLYSGRTKPIDPELQKEFNANIPECAESERLAKELRELNRSYYYENELTEFTKKSIECLDKIPAYTNKKKTMQKNKFNSLTNHSSGTLYSAP